MAQQGMGRMAREREREGDRRGVSRYGRWSIWRVVRDGASLPTAHLRTCTRGLLLIYYSLPTDLLLSGSTCMALIACTAAASEGGARCPSGDTPPSGGSAPTPPKGGSARAP